MKKKLIIVMAAILAISQAAFVMAADKAVEFKPVTQTAPKMTALPGIVKTTTDSHTSKQSSADQKAHENMALQSLVKSLQAALANSDSKVKQIEGERQKLSLEVQVIKSQLSAANAELQALRMGGKSKLVTLADSGEAVFFKGIGEARMAAADGKTVIRFPLTASNKADRVLLGAKAEKHMNGAFVYYIMDSAGLVF